MRVAVASKNPIKIRAVENVMKKIYGNIEVMSIQLNHGMPYTPLGDEELMKGAKTRALQALEVSGADLGIGLEGGLSQHGSLYYLSTWAAIADRNSDVSFGNGGGIEIPERFVQEVIKGRELGDIVDEYFREDNAKQKMGLSGILTNNHVERQTIMEHVLTYAMARKLNPHLYEK